MAVEVKFRRGPDRLGTKFVTHFGILIYVGGKWRLYGV